MRRVVSGLCAAVIVAALSGCGGSGGGQEAQAPSPPASDQTPAPTEEVGPFVMHTTATSGFQMQTVPNDSGAAFVTVHGAKIDYVATQEMLDRVAFASLRDGSSPDIYICDLFGGNVKRVTNTATASEAPEWSPTADSIAYSHHDGNDYEIAIVTEDGSSTSVITSHNADDKHPTWSPDGRRLAFYSYRDGDNEIYTIYASGMGSTNISNASASEEYDPDWSPTGDELLFASDRTGFLNIYRMATDGSAQAAVTTATSGGAEFPTYHPGGTEIAYNANWPGDKEIYTDSRIGGTTHRFSNTPALDARPAWSTDGRFICYDTTWSGMAEIYVQEVAPPYRAYQVTPGGGWAPHLGSPTLQTSRVLIGPSGSDRGFDPPITPSVAYGAVMAFRDNGYLNFVRIGIYGHHADQLKITPRDHVGDQVVALEVTAPQLINVVQDSGPGETAGKWSLAGTTTAALLMFNPDSGKLSSVLALEDEALSAAADGQSGPTFEETATGTVVSGSFSAVYDAMGELVAEGDIDSVKVDTEAGTTSVL